MQTQGLEFRLERDRTGLSPDALKHSLSNHLFYLRGTLPQNATLYDYYIALVHTVRDRLLQRWATLSHGFSQPSKQVAYFSSKFLAAPQLSTSLLNLGISAQMQQVADELGFNLPLLLQQDELVTGSREFGQLATCHLDSLATLGVDSIAYGIRYEFDLCREHCPGQAVETIDQWLRHDGNPWEISHPERSVSVKFGGSTESYLDEQGRFRVRWLPTTVVQCIPYDVPISGYRSQKVNTLRLWSASQIETLTSSEFLACVKEKVGTTHPSLALEHLITVLSVENQTIDYQCLYLQQQFFFISCSLQDAIRIHCQQQGEPIHTLADRFAFQLNEVHHAIAIPELMRLLMDEHGLDWDTAWYMTQAVFTYTHQVLLTEELERFPINLFEEFLPRHLEIIYEINKRFLAGVRAKHPEDEMRVQRMSLIDESGKRYIRLTHLAYVGSHVISSVAGLHTKLLKQESLRDFFSFFPERFKSRSSRVIPDRFMAAHNPALTQLITRKIGDRWLNDLNELKVLELLAQDSHFCEEWQSLKRSLKQAFAKQILEQKGVQINPDSLFDVHTRSMSERHRQHLSLLYIITLYNRIKANPAFDFQPRTIIFNESAPSPCYVTQLIVQLARAVAEVVNSDPDVGDRLKIVFLEQINGLSPSVYAAADLIEQLTIASADSSGVESMKFALTGALTIGALSPVNIEIRNQVGEANFFLFGLAVEEVNALKASGYNPWNFYHNNRELQGAIDRIASGHFADGDSSVFKPFIDETFGRGDEYLLLADYPFYVDCQDRVGEAYRDTDWWTQMAILNAARIGYFSSDRVMRDYCRDIWNISV
jgi:starch phosphorylase